MGTSLTEINKTLKRILDHLRKEESATVLALFGGSSHQTILNQAAVEALLTTIQVNTAPSTDDTIADHLREIEARLFANGSTIATHVRNSLLELQAQSNTILPSIDEQLEFANVDLAALEVLATTAATARSDINSELDSIDANWNLLSLNQLNLAAILVAVLNNATSGRQDIAQTSFDAMVVDLAAIEVKQIAIDASLNAIEQNTIDMEVVLLDQQTQCLLFVADFDVTGIGGGTDMVFDMVMSVEQCVVISMRTVYTGAGTNNLTIQLLATNDLTKVVSDIEPGFNASAGSVEHWPDDTANGSPYDTGDHHLHIPSGLTLRIKWTGVAVNDRFFVVLRGTARKRAAPTVNTTATTATITTTTTISMTVD